MKPWLKWTLISGGAIVGIWLVVALILGLTGYTGRLHEREARERAAATAPPATSPTSSAAPNPTAASTPATSVAPTTTAVPSSPAAGRCPLAPKRDMLLWEHAPGLPDHTIRIGDVDGVHCAPTLTTWRVAQPDGVGYCSRIAWADDNPGYDEHRVPAAALVAVLDQVGGSC